MLTVRFEAMDNRTRDLLAGLFRSGPLSNQELAHLLGVSPSTVTSLTGALLQQGVLASRDAQQFDREIASGERRKRTFGLNAEYGWAAVVEIDFDGVTIYAVRFDLTLGASRRVPTDSGDRDGILAVVESELPGFLEEQSHGNLLGLGFTMPGQVDSGRAIGVHNTRISHWDNVRFDRFASLSENIVAENVANAAAFGEYCCGTARGTNDFILIHIGNGAGMGIVIDGKLHRGHNFSAGEAGHVIVDESSSITCNCGNRGCLESFVSRRAVLRELEQLRESEVPSGILSDTALGDGDAVYRLLGDYDAEGDKVAYLVVEDLAHKVGLAAANFAQILAPERIVLSGPISHLGDRFLHLVEQNLKRYHLPWLDSVPVVYGREDSESVALGAAALVFSRFWEQ